MSSLFAPLVRSSFWFDLQTQPFSSWVNYIILFFIAALFAASVYVFHLRRAAQEKLVKRAWGQAFTACLSATLIGLVLYAITWQRIPVLGMRIFWPIWFLAHAAWGWAIYRRAQKQIPATRRTQAERQAYEKWLPKAKK